MRFCKFCGQQIPDNAVFCKHCGKELRNDTLTINTKKNPGKLTTAEIAELTDCESIVTRGVKMRTGLLVWGIILILIPSCMTLNILSADDKTIWGYIGLVLSIGPAAMIIGATVGYAKQKAKVKNCIARIAELKAKRGY